MSRSLKKPFFVEEKLFNRIEAMNASGDKKVIKTWSRASTIFPSSSVIRSPYTTDTSTSRYMLPRIWWDTSSANLLLRAPSRVTRDQKRPITVNKP